MFFVLFSVNNSDESDEEIQPLKKKKKKNTIVQDAEAPVELLSQCSNAVAVCGKVLHERGVHVRKSCLTTECPCKFQNERCGEQCSCFHCSNGKQEAKDILVAEKPQETDPRDVQLDMVRQLKNTSFIRIMKSPVFAPSLLHRKSWARQRILFAQNLQRSN